MSKLVGCALIFSGIGIAAWAAQGTGEPPEADSANIMVERVAAVAIEPTGKPQAFVAPAALFQQPSAAVAAPTPKTPANIQPPRRTPVTPFKTVAVPNNPGAIARELQKELKRVGCYWGEINGVWTPGTKQAMKAFTERVNATLPIEGPDYILLTLVQGHEGKACGAPCPAGQGAGLDGRCMPDAILAQAARKAANATRVATLPTARAAAARPIGPSPGAGPVSAWLTTTNTPNPAGEPIPPSAPAAQPPLPGRMALAGPTSDAPPELEKAPPRPRPHVQRERRQYAQTQPPPNSGAWVRALFRKMDGGLY